MNVVQVINAVVVQDRRPNLPSKLEPGKIQITYTIKYN